MGTLPHAPPLLLSPAPEVYVSAAAEGKEVRSQVHKASSSPDLDFKAIFCRRCPQKPIRIEVRGRSLASVCRADELGEYFCLLRLHRSRVGLPWRKDWPLDGWGHPEGRQMSARVSLLPGPGWLPVCFPGGPHGGHVSTTPGSFSPGAVCSSGPLHPSVHQSLGRARSQRSLRGLCHFRLCQFCILLLRAGPAAVLLEPNWEEARGLSGHVLFPGPEFLQRPPCSTPLCDLCPPPRSGPGGSCAAPGWGTSSCWQTPPQRAALPSCCPWRGLPRPVPPPTFWWRP